MHATGTAGLGRIYDQPQTVALLLYGAHPAKLAGWARVIQALPTSAL